MMKSMSKRVSWRLVFGLLAHVVKPFKLFWLLVAMGCVVSFSAFAERHALIIGVDQVATLPAITPLLGVTHDVRLMSNFARDEWGVPLAHLHVLAATQDATAAPVYKAVFAAMSQIAREARTGDEVLVYLSGHGFKQPAYDDVTEVDHYDEVFALADTTRWDPALRSVRNALIDNDLRDWMEGLAKNGAHIWLIVDSCYAGGMARGDGNSPDRIGAWPVTARKFAFPEWLGIGTPPATDAARARAKSRRRAKIAIPGLAPAKAILKDTAAPSPVLAFYAAGEDGEAVEVKVDGKEVGLLTYLFMQSVRQNALLESLRNKVHIPGQSYKDLVDKLALAYANLPTRAPRPVFEGSQWSRPVFMNSTLPKKTKD